MKSGCRSCALAAASSSALGISRRKITHTSTSIWAMPVRSSAPIALRYSVSIRACAHAKPIRKVVLTVTWTELLLPSSCRPLPASARRHRPAVSGGLTMATNDPNSAGATSVTTAEPAIAVARDQVIDRVADHPWDEVEDPCPPPARSSRATRSAASDLHSLDRSPRMQRNPGDAELLSERTASANWIGTKRK
jgi:hypothetical protein